MDREGVHRVVDPQVHQEGRRAHIERGADEADAHGRAGLDGGAGRRNGHEATADAVADAADVVLAPTGAVPTDQELEDQGREPSDCRGQRRVHGHEGRLVRRPLVVQPEGGAAAGAVRAEPENERGDDDEPNLVGCEGLRGLPPSVPRATHDSAHEGTHTPDHVDDATAGVVHESHVVYFIAGEPALAPCPRDPNRVYGARHDDGENDTGHEMRALGDTAAGDGRRHSAEHPLGKPLRAEARRRKIAIRVGPGKVAARKIVPTYELLACVCQLGAVADCGIVGIGVLHGAAVGKRKTKEKPAQG
mmetsp:Transcript_57863/g.163339  ORF Transcript_57863/g.163339 Transcript_57863/m.163339 type:complete len:304 (+) Transcript_57863:333-1244(+)